MASLHERLDEFKKSFECGAPLYGALREPKTVREVGYGLSLKGASAADLIRSLQARSEHGAQEGKVA